MTVLKLNFSMNWPYMSYGSLAFAFKSGIALTSAEGQTPI